MCFILLSILLLFGRIARTQCMRWYLLLQMSHVAWSVCLCLSVGHVTFFGGSEDLCLLRWQNLKACRTWCFGNDIPNGTPRCSVFAKEFGVFVPNAISHHGRPSQFVLICFNARRLDNSASLLVPHNLESWISHPKESELHLICFGVSLS